MPHLRSVDKGTCTFLLLRRVQLHVYLRANFWLNFTPKITKTQEPPGASPLGPPPRRCPGPNGGIKAAPRFHAFEKKPDPPLKKNKFLKYIIGICLDHTYIHVHSTSSSIYMQFHSH